LSASITLLERKSYEKDESEASKRQVDLSNSSIIIGFFISRIALEPLMGHTFLPEFQQQTKYVIVENEFRQHRIVCVLFIFT